MNEEKKICGQTCACKNEDECHFQHLPSLRGSVIPTVSKENFPTEPVIGENLTSEQASNYCDFAGVKTAEAVEQAAEQSAVLGWQLSKYSEDYQERVDISKEDFINGANWQRTHTLNAVRGIIEAPKIALESRMIAGQELSDQEAIEHLTYSRILTEINKL